MVRGVGRYVGKYGVDVLWVLVTVHDVCDDDGDTVHAIIGVATVVDRVSGVTLLLLVVLQC